MQIDVHCTRKVLDPFKKHGRSIRLNLWVASARLIAEHPSLSIQSGDLVCVNCLNFTVSHVPRLQFTYRQRWLFCWSDFHTSVLHIITFHLMPSAPLSGIRWQRYECAILQFLWKNYLCSVCNTKHRIHNSNNYTQSSSTCCTRWRKDGTSISSNKCMTAATIEISHRLRSIGIPTNG